MLTYERFAKTFNITHERHLLLKDKNVSIPKHYLNFFIFLADVSLDEFLAWEKTHAIDDTYLINFSDNISDDGWFNADILQELFDLLINHTQLSECLALAVINSQHQFASKPLLCKRNTTSRYQFFRQAWVLKNLIDNIAQYSAWNDVAQRELQSIHLSAYLAKSVSYVSRMPEHWFWHTWLSLDKKNLKHFLNNLKSKDSKPDILCRATLFLLLGADDKQAEENLKCTLEQNKQNMTLLQNFVSAFESCAPHTLSFFLSQCVSLNLVKKSHCRRSIQTFLGLTPFSEETLNIKLKEIIYLLSQYADGIVFEEAFFAKTADELYLNLIVFGLINLDEMCHLLIKNIDRFSLDRLEIIVIYLFNTGMFEHFNQFSIEIFKRHFKVCIQPLNPGALKLLALISSLQISCLSEPKNLIKNDVMFWQITTYFSELEPILINYPNLKTIDFDHQLIDRKIDLDNRYSILLSLFDHSEKMTVYFMDNLALLPAQLKKILLHTVFSPCSMHSHSIKVDNTKMFTVNSANLGLLSKFLLDKDTNINMKSIALCHVIKEELPIEILEQLFLYLKRNKRILNQMIIDLLSSLSDNQFAKLINSQYKTKIYALQKALINLLVIRKSINTSLINEDWYPYLSTMNKLKPQDVSQLNIIFEKSDEHIDLLLKHLPHS